MPRRDFVLAAYDLTSKCFDIFYPLTGECSEALDAIRFFFKHTYIPGMLKDKTFMGFNWFVA